MDNHIALLDEQGRASRRGAIRRLDVSGEALGSQHSPFWVGSGDDITPAEGVTITTVSVVDGAFTVHVHIIDTPDPITMPLRIGGYAVANPKPSPRDPARVTSPLLVSGLHPLSEGLEAGTHETRSSNPYGDGVAVPILRGHHSGLTSVHVVATELRGTGTVATRTPRVTQTLIDGDTVSIDIDLSDGSSRTLTTSTARRAAEYRGKEPRDSTTP